MVRANLVLQVVILSLVFLGLVFRFRGKFLWHAGVMLVVVVLSAVSFFVVMRPSFLGWVGFLELQPLNRFSLVIVGHVVFGGLAEVAGVWLVGSWRLRSSVEGCVPRKNVMLAAAPLWGCTITLGILLYTLLYTNLLWSGQFLDCAASFQGQMGWLLRCELFRGLCFLLLFLVGPLKVCS